MNELQELKQQLDRLEKRTESIYRSVEKTRKYFLATLIVTVLTIVLPIIGMVVLIPMYLSRLNLAGLGI